MTQVHRRPLCHFVPNFDYSIIEVSTWTYKKKVTEKIFQGMMFLNHKLPIRHTKTSTRHGWELISPKMILNPIRSLYNSTNFKEISCITDLERFDSVLIGRCEFKHKRWGNAEIFRTVQAGQNSQTTPLLSSPRQLKVHKVAASLARIFSYL